VRRVARRLGRLERNAGFLALAGVLGCAASSASAAPAPQVFFLTISGTASADFDHTSAPVKSGDCELSTRSEGIRTARFRSSRPTRVRFVAGDLQTVTAGAIAGTVKLSGPNTSNEVCPGSEKHTLQPCPKTTRTFKNARTNLIGTGPGTITLRPLRVRLRRIHCPQEPEDLLALPLGPAHSPLRIPRATLANRRITRITLTASASRRKDFKAPEHGTIEQRSSWTLTFTRVRP
jgi:hypothetical protein